MPIRVMIVEDDRVTRELMEIYVRSALELELCPSAADGQEALALIRRDEPDLVLLDLVMPTLDGVQVLEELLSDPPPKRPKIIVTSAISSDGVVREAMGLGADYYVVKPCNIPALLRRIGALFAPPTPEGTDPGAACLLRMGADERGLGFRFARSALSHLAGPGDEPQLKAVYLQVAEEFHSGYDRVERNLRTMIRRLHALGSPQYAALFGAAERPPANGVFLRTLAQELRGKPPHLVHGT